MKRLLPVFSQKPRSRSPPQCSPELLGWVNSIQSRILSKAQQLQLKAREDPPPICMTLNMVIVLLCSYRFTGLWDCMA